MGRLKGCLECRTTFKTFFVDIRNVLNQEITIGLRLQKVAATDPTLSIRTQSIVLLR